MRKLFVRLLWTLLLLGVISVVVAVYAINEGWIGYMPPVEDMQNPISKYATQVYSSDGKLLGTWNKDRENRQVIDYTKLSPALVHALVATEDIRFYNHSGIDFYALGRAFIKRGILGQKSAGGGSTITQQLAKQLYTTEKARSTMERLLQKPIEWVIAVKLERNYTKDEIIAMYLNKFDFLHNAVGIKTAANTYFNKDPMDLTVSEAAMLVGMCKNPSYYNPVRYPERAQERRNVVLRQMVRADYINEEQYAQYSAEPLTLNFRKADHKEGIAVYFRDFLRRYMMAKEPNPKDYPSWGRIRYYQDSVFWANDPLYGWCNKNFKKNGDPYSVSDGLKVYTTIDSRMQQYAEQACYEHVVKYLQPEFDKLNKKRTHAPYSSNLTSAEINKILNRSVRQSDRYRVMKAYGASDEDIDKAFRTKTEMSVFTYHGEVDTMMTPLDSIRYYKSFLRCGFMSMDPRNGHVKAYVGGLNLMHFAYDMVMEGRRQVGSTIKPFLYSLAMMNGFSPCDVAPNVQTTYVIDKRLGKTWTPRNSSHARYGEMVTLKWGLQQSNNWISAYLMSRLSPKMFVELLHRYGINNPDIHPSMSLCLGPCEITVGEMVSAYSAFVNNGIRASHMFVTKIEDSEGNVLAQFQPRLNEVISETAADKMLYMLKTVVDGGTASRLRHKYNFTGDLAGKTGTTNNNSDAWFMGITPSLVTGCWVGGDDRDIHFDSMQMGQGATMALPIFAIYMNKVFKDQHLGYNEKAVFDLDVGYDPCASSEVNDEQFDIEDVYE